MASEKEEFITKKYIPTGAPIVENDRTLIYKVRCMEEPGRPRGNFENVPQTECQPPLYQTHAA